MVRVGRVFHLVTLPETAGVTSRLGAPTGPQRTVTVRVGLIRSDGQSAKEGKAGVLHEKATQEILQ